DLQESPESALTVLSEAYELGVERERILEHIERLAQKYERHEDLLAALERKLLLIPAERPALAAAILRQQAYVARVELGDAARALAFLRRALEHLPGDQLLLMEATEAAEASGRSNEAAELYAMRLSGADDTERPALAFARALALARAGADPEAEEVLAALDA